MNTAIFCEWFIDYLVPKIPEHDCAINLAFEVFLTFINLSIHKLEFEGSYPNVCVVFLSVISSIMQLMDHSIIANMKTFNLKHTFL